MANTRTTNQRRPLSRHQQPVKGMIMLRPDAPRAGQAPSLMKALGCVVVENRGARIVVTCSRGNMEAIKDRWLHSEAEDQLTMQLRENVAQIIIGRA